MSRIAICLSVSCACTLCIGGCMDDPLDDVDTNAREETPPSDSERQAKQKPFLISSSPDRLPKRSLSFLVR